MYLHIIDRATAIAAGLKFYFTGKPCKRNNFALRRCSTGKCRCGPCVAAAAASDTGAKARGIAWRAANQDRQRAHERRWRKNNRQKERQRQRDFHCNNPGKRSEYGKKCYCANSEIVLERKRAYYRGNPDKARIYVARRRAAKISRTPAWLTDTNKASIAEIYRLAAERRRQGELVEVDHVVPLVGKLVCGLHVPWNLAIIPALDNRKKNNEFRPQEHQLP